MSSYISFDLNILYIIKQKHHMFLIIFTNNNGIIGESNISIMQSI